MSIVPSNKKRLRLSDDDLALLPSLILTFPRLSSRWNQGCHNVALLYEEIVAASDTRVRSGRFRCGFVLFARKSHTPSPNRRSSGTNPLLPEALRL